MAPMTQSAQFGIVGGGIIGLATAWALARDGARDVVVFESEPMTGTQATAKCAGGIRAQFSTKVNIELSQYSIEKFLRFHDDHGIEVDFHQHGYLFLLDNEEDMGRFRNNVVLQQSLGVDVREVTPDDIREMQPHLKVDDLVGGTYCPTDGYGDPHGFCNGYATLCRREGVRIELDTAVTELSGLDGPTTRVRTTRGDWDVETVLVANGAWSAELLSNCGVTIPMKPYKRQIHVTKPFEGVTDPVPLTIDFGAGLYFHRESGGLLLGAADPEQGPGFDQSVNDDFMETIVMSALNRVPALETAELLSGWGGLYAITPDNHALMGALEEARGVYYATGFSGHGFMHAPAVADCMAAVMTGRPSPIDIEALDVHRFAAGRATEEFNVF